MTYRPYRADDPVLTVECPACFSRPGEACRKRSAAQFGKHAAYTHDARIKAWEDAQDKRAAQKLAFDAMRRLKDPDYRP